MDTTEALIKWHEEVCAKAKDLMAKKNKDYARGGTPFANFTLCESMGVCSTEEGIIVRMTDKIRRLASLVDGGTPLVEGESFTDTIIDIVNYSIILSAWRQKQVMRESEERDANPFNGDVYSIPF